MLLSIAAFLAATGTPAPAAREFDALRGSWTGTGTVHHANGSKERLRCRASYQPADTVLSMQLTCASDSYKFELRSALVSAGGGKLNGTWSETTRTLQGHVNGTMQGDVVRATVTSPTFSANLTVRTSNRTQTVTIESPGSSIANVTISLRR